VSRSEFDTEVVVVRAGLAGLSAAWRLVREGLDVRVLEARDRVGGRIQSRQATEETILDLGGQWIGPGQHHVLDRLG
jgi:monoamine oxidase